MSMPSQKGELEDSARNGGKSETVVGAGRGDPGGNESSDVDGSAYAPFLAPLAGNPNVMEKDASSLINVTLNGTQDLVIQGRRDALRPVFQQPAPGRLQPPRRFGVRRRLHSPDKDILPLPITPFADPIMNTEQIRKTPAFTTVLETLNLRNQIDMYRVWNCPP